jgi:hypothetical protein
MDLQIVVTMYPESRRNGRGTRHSSFLFEEMDRQELHNIIQRVSFFLMNEERVYRELRQGPDQGT